ncbi:MAG: ribonuclease III [Firmicutes bacterium]|nr:ribonuclease III [Bacillota bacterium]
MLNDEQLDNILILGEKLAFPEDKLELLEQALTHPTFFEGAKKNGRDDNQRLEFLGDAVLDMIVAEYLYQKYPEAREGDLTKMRALIVCEASLGRAAAEFKIGDALLLGKGAEATGDRKRASVLGDAMEAVIGAIYMAMGLEAARDFVLSQFEDDMQNLTREDYEDAKSLLQEYIQSFSEAHIHYELLNTDGPSHAPVFTMGVFLNGKMLAKASASSKKEAEQLSARQALQNKKKWKNLLTKN